MVEYYETENLQEIGVRKEFPPLTRVQAIHSEKRARDERGLDCRNSGWESRQGVDIRFVTSKITMINSLKFIGVFFFFFCGSKYYTKF